MKSKTYCKACGKKRYLKQNKYTVHDDIYYLPSSMPGKHVVLMFSVAVHLSQHVLHGVP